MPSQEFPGSPSRENTECDLIVQNSKLMFVTRINPMNRNQFTGNLKQLKGKVREKWGWWTHRYSSVFSGKINQLAGKIQSLYGRVRK
jgi:uncharacterized protein YjbJ (UPF0337 family)